jgi:hypothetical protein
MAYSAADIEQLRALLTFLRQSFGGASVGQLKVDDMADALERVLATL